MNAIRAHNKALIPEKCPNCPELSGMAGKQGSTVRRVRTVGGQHRASIGTDTRHGQTHAEWAASVKYRYLAEGLTPPENLDQYDRWQAFEAERRAAADMPDVPF